MSAEEYLPPRLSLKGLREAAAGCRGCDLYKDANQTVFGEGKKSSRMMLVGETPGDVEDREGHVFVGPAGHELDRALEDARDRPRDVYLTNAVKHFRFEERGKRRIHQTPTARQITACSPWLGAELRVVNRRRSSSWAPSPPSRCSATPSGSPSSAARCSTATWRRSSWRRSTRRRSCARPTSGRAGASARRSSNDLRVALRAL